MTSIILQKIFTLLDYKSYLIFIKLFSKVSIIVLSKLEPDNIKSINPINFIYSNYYS